MQQDRSILDGSQGEPYSGTCSVSSLLPVTSPSEPERFCCSSDSSRLDTGHKSCQKTRDNPDCPGFQSEHQWESALRGVEDVLDDREKLFIKSRAVAEALRARGWRQDASNLEGCGTWLMLRAYAQTGRARLREANFCSLTRACPGCARIRAARTSDVYTSKTLAILDRAFDEGAPLPLPRMVTVTVPAGEDLVERYKKLTSCLKRLSQARRNARRRGVGGEWTKPEHFAWSVEIKRARNHRSLWHVHAHGVCLASQRMDLQAIHDEWSALAGGKHWPDVRLLNSGRHLLSNRSSLRMASVREELRQDLKEVFKYSVKFGGSSDGEDQLSAADVAEVYLSTKKRRLVFGWDGYRGCKVSDDLRDLAEDPGEFMDFHFARRNGECRHRLYGSRSGEGERLGPWLYEQ